MANDVQVVPAAVFAGLFAAAALCCVPVNLRMTGFKLYIPMTLSALGVEGGYNHPISLQLFQWNF
jgi:hypothetical protein